MAEHNVVFTTLHADRPWSLETYLSIDGYQAWRRILAEKTPAAPASPEPAAGASGGPSAVEELMAALRESVEQAKSKGRPRPRSKKAG